MKKFFIVLLICLLVVTVACGVYYFVNNHKENTPTICRHETLSVIDGVTATCTSSGLTSGVKCEDCGKVLIDQQTIPALGHDVEFIPSTSATCRTHGLTMGACCKRCGEVVLSQEQIMPLGHDLIYHAAEEPTCTSDGHSAYVTCSRCSYTTYQVLHALGHKAYEFSYETTDGNIVSYKKCLYCGEQLSESITTVKPEIEDDDMLYIYDVDKISAFEYYGKDIRYVYISPDVKYVGSCAFANCPQYLVIEVSTECDTSTWAEDWFYGNGDGDTPYTVIYKDEV